MKRQYLCEYLENEDLKPCSDSYQFEYLENEDETLFWFISIWVPGEWRWHLVLIPISMSTGRIKMKSCSDPSQYEYLENEDKTPFWFIKVN